jgi:Na+/phosphate symporter
VCFAGTLSAGLFALLLMRSGIRRPLAPALWGAFALSCNAVSGRVTFALGVFFGLAAVTVVFAARGPRAPKAAAVVVLGVLATLASPVAGLFLEVAAAALFLTRRRRPAYALAAGPPFVVALTALVFPFKGVQPFPWFLVAAPVASSVALALYAPKSWRNVRVGAVVYAIGTVLTWLIPSQVGSNVDRLALLFGGAVMLAAAMERKIAILYIAFAATVVSQVIRPVFDVVNTGSPDGHTTGVLAELRNLGADRGRVEVVPERTHLESSEFAPVVNLARGWNRQADVNRNPLFYDGSLTPDTYHAWLRRWAVRYVVLSDSTPDWQGMEEARIVGAGQPWLKQIWRDEHWHLYELARPEPLADPPATVATRGRRRARHQRSDQRLGARTRAVVALARRPRRPGGLRDRGRRLDPPVRSEPGPLPPRRQLPAAPRNPLLRAQEVFPSPVNERRRVRRIRATARRSGPSNSTKPISVTVTPTTEPPAMSSGAAPASASERTISTHAPPAANPNLRPARNSPAAVAAAIAA